MSYRKEIVKDEKGLPMRPCDICGTIEATPVNYDPRVVVCSGCGFVHVKERRSVEEIARAWDDVYENGLYDPTWPGVRARLFYVAEWLDQHVGLKGKSVLDIGAGDGFFLDQCRTRDAHPVGLDPAVSNVDKIKARDIACWNGWIDENSPKVGEYDIITLNWCLENTGDLNTVLKFARDHLAKDGIVSVATGSRIMSGFRKPISRYFNKDIPADLHCFHFAPLSLQNALHCAGIGTIKHNDFQENDVLIMCGVSATPDAACVYGLDDHAEHVKRFFTDWERQWP